MLYLTYSQYTEMGGTAPQSSFNRAIFRASKTIDRVTHGRIENENPVRDAVKNLCFELVQIVVSKQDETRQISSMSNDGISISYASTADEGKRINDLIRDYLAEERTENGTFLLYAGVDG